MKFLLSDVSYRYNQNSNFSLKDISASFDSTRIIGLAGANGSGKTTLINILTGQFIGFLGSYKIDEKNIHDKFGSLLSTYKIGFAPDIPVLDDLLTGREIMSLVAQIRSIDDATLKKEIDLFKTFLYIEEWFDLSPCKEYSAGMRKKLSLAIALFGFPEFIILDEPLNALDPIAAFGLKQLILHKNKQGCGFLLSSHILDFIEKSADQLIMLKKGEMCFSGTMQELGSLYPSLGSLEEIYFTLYKTDMPGDDQDTPLIQ